MERRTFLSRLAVLSAAAWAGLAHHRDWHTGGPKPEPEPGPEPTPEPPDGLLSGDYPDGIVVPENTTAEVVGLVTTPRNVEVYGSLVMRPGATLRFRDVDETAFVGGGAEPLATDVGLWVMGSGRLDWQGTPRVAWNRIGTDPSWQNDDELMVAPYLQGDYGAGRDRDGSPPMFEPHEFGAPAPSVDVEGHEFTTEVFNLTRDVVIEGTPGGRAHIFIHSDQPQTVRHVVIRHMGPRQADPVRGGTRDVLGRYGLHFHLSGDGSRGSLVEGVVVRDGGGHAFVPHGSHGITFLDCVSFNTTDDAYWWDSDTVDSYPLNASFDILFERCAAFMVRDKPDFTHHRLAGFRLGQGERNACVGCVTAGVQGGGNSSGFNWPDSAAAHPNLWRFEDNVAHNNRSNGIFVWQNDRKVDHLTDRFTAWHCGRSGIEHGAYRNSYHYRGALLVGNGGGVKLHAVSRDTLRFDGIHVVGGAYGLYVDRHSQDANSVGVLAGWTVENVTHAVHVREGDRGERSWYDLADWVYDGRALTCDDVHVESIHPETAIRVVQGDDVCEVRGTGLGA